MIESVDSEKSRSKRGLNPEGRSYSDISITTGYRDLCCHLIAVTVLLLQYFVTYDDMTLCFMSPLS